MYKKWNRLDTMFYIIVCVRLHWRTAVSPMRLHSAVCSEHRRLNARCHWRRSRWRRKGKSSRSELQRDVHIRCQGNTRVEQNCGGTTSANRHVYEKYLKSYIKMSLHNIAMRLNSPLSIASMSFRRKQTRITPSLPALRPSLAPSRVSRSQWLD